jgi:hypothetical protein
MPAPPPLFTLEAVNALLPRLRALMEAQIARRTEIERGLDRLAGLLGRAPADLEVAVHDPPRVCDLKRSLGAQVEVYRSAWGELEEMGAVLKDARTGLVDFYGRVDGKLVCLCWKYGEEAVAHYHGLDEGFGGRKPIEPHMRQRHLH